MKVKMIDASIVVSIGAKSRQCRDLLGGVEGTGAEDGETELQLRQSRLTETREPSASCQFWGRWAGRMAKAVTVSLECQQK